MDSVVLKLILTPTLVGAASLAGRRWGPTVSGWLVGLPLTSGPIIFFLAHSHGAAFAQTAALGTLSGTMSQAFVCLTYSWLANRFSWPVTLGLSVLVFVGITSILQFVTLPAAGLFLMVILVLGLSLRLMPQAKVALAGALPLPAWDIPARMIVATVYVLTLTGLAPTLGPHLSGLLAPFPLYALILAGFAHHLEGPARAIQVLEGLLLGLFAFATFFLILASLIEQVSLGVVFTLAIAGALVLQSSSLWFLRRRQKNLLR